jgi:excisionase family DNA binding protein
MVLEDDGEKDGLLTIRQVAEKLNIHPNTVRVYSNAGLLHAIRLPGRGDRRFRKEDVERLVNASLWPSKPESKE